MLVCAFSLEVILSFKEIIHPKMIVISYFTFPHVVWNLYDFHFSAEHTKKKYFKEGVNGSQQPACFIVPLWDGITKWHVTVTISAFIDHDIDTSLSSTAIKNHEQKWIKRIISSTHLTLIKQTQMHKNDYNNTHAQVSRKNINHIFFDLKGRQIQAENIANCCGKRWWWNSCK